MFKGLRKMVGLLSLEERLQEYLALEEQEAIEKSNRDQLALSYAEHTRTLNLCKSETDEFVVNKIQDKYDTFFEEYKNELVKAKKSYDKLKSKREKLLKSEELSKAVKLHKAHEKFDNGEISLEIYDKIIKAVTKNKVKYADIIVWNDEWKFLILQRAKGDKNGGKWVIPGGHVDPGESFEEAAKRELLEEAGLKIDKCEKVGTFTNNDVEIYYYEASFDKEDKENEFVITLEEEETHDYKWISVDELKDYEMIFDMKENLDKILKPWKKSVVKLTKAFLSGLITDKEVFKKAISMVIEKAKHTPFQQAKIDSIEKSEGYSNEQLKELIKEHERVVSVLKPYIDKDSKIKKEYDIQVKELASYKEQLSDVVEKAIESDEIMKARSGKYADTAENRKMNRVGQTYGSAKKEEPAKDKKPAKQEEQQDLGSAAQEASETALIAASKGKDKEHREVAHAELQRREKEEKPQEEDEAGEEEETEVEKVENEIKKLRETESYDIDEITGINDKIQDLLEQRKQLVEDEKSLRKVDFEEYRKGFESFTGDSYDEKKKRSNFYGKQTKDIEKYLSKNPNLGSAIDAYVGESYEDIREILSHPEDYEKEEDLGEFEHKMLAQVEDISKYINDNKLSENLSLNRRVKANGGNGFFEKLDIGDVYEDKSFSSTSLYELDRFGDFNIEILAKKGSSVANIDNIAEYEYVIDKGSKFRVLDKNDKGMVVELL